jgi:hypothetical protein
MDGVPDAQRTTSPSMIKQQNYFNYPYAFNSILLSTPSFLPSFLPSYLYEVPAAEEAMGICCSKGKEELEEGFPWKHDAFFHDQLWSAGVSMHTKQGWKGANQDAMTTCQVTTSLLHWIACSSHCCLIASMFFPVLLCLYVQILLSF